MPVSLLASFLISKQRHSTLANALDQASLVRLCSRLMVSRLKRGWKIQFALASRFGCRRVSRLIAAIDGDPAILAWKQFLKEWYLVRG
jgi:hypothetical protein